MTDASERELIDVMEAWDRAMVTNDADAIDPTGPNPPEDTEMPSTGETNPPPSGGYDY